MYVSRSAADDSGDLMTGRRRCLQCDKLKEIDQFHWATNRRYRRRTCSPCLVAAAAKRRAQRSAEAQSVDFASRLRRSYGLSVESFEWLLQRQHGACAICREVFSEQTGRQLHIDHDHKTGSVRGLLCFTCNTAIGKLRDDPDLLRAAIDYLESQPLPMQRLPRLLSAAERSVQAMSRRQKGDLKVRRQRHSASVSGARNPAARVTFESAETIRARYRAGGVSQRQLAEEFGCSQALVSKIVRNEAWTESPPVDLVERP